MANYKLTGVFPEGQPAHWNQAVPYPRPIRWGMRPVPNAQSVGPIGMAQFAPKYNPAGSGSVQPYVYPDGPWVNPYGYRTANPAALTAGGVTVQRPFESDLGGVGVRRNPCGCGSYGDPLVTLPVVGDVTPKCLVAVAVGLGLGWYFWG